MLSEEEYITKKEIELERMKWDNVNSIALFVVDNLQGEETSVISYLQIIGTPLKLSRR